MGDLRPLCGANGNGIAVVARGVAMWGDPVAPRPHGGVGPVTQSGNVGVNALAVGVGSAYTPSSRAVTRRWSMLRTICCPARP
jgi:hypothetical protein